MSVKKTNNINTLYNISVAFITDNDTTFIQNDSQINFIKTIPGKSYLLTIDLPTDGITHIINSDGQKNAPAAITAPKGTIKLYCNGRLVEEYETRTAVAPLTKYSDNCIKRFIRRMRENSFFKLVDLVQERKHGHIILRDNKNIIHTILNKNQQMTK